MQKSFFINGVDFTSFTPRAGYSVSYIKRKGNNGGMVLTGKMKDDTLAVKAVVTFPIMPMLGDAQVHTLLAALYEYNTPNITYFEPLVNDYRTVEMMFDDEEVRHLGENINSDNVWKSPSLTFTEC